MELWAHQQRVFDLLATGKNVILQAPTGSGKTRAALYPFLCGLDIHNPINSIPLPAKCIYSVPMRVLAKQFNQEYKEIVERYGLRFGLNIKSSIQTGEQAEDRRLEANLIFATIDQTLSSFLLAPYSQPRRHANINAAAVMGSYLVFDEFHLYDPDSMLPTTLHMLRMLKGVTPFVLMTATFSADMLYEISKLLDAEVVPGDKHEREQLQNLESQQKIRRYHLANQPLSAEVVLDKHNRRSLVICNTVDRARQIYEELERLNPVNTQLLLLHSRFLREHRNVTEETIRTVFGKDHHEGSYIAVATQAIEVGVDMTSTVLHTELAPANAILQRAGRCARYPGDEGDVYIYQHSFQGDAEVDLLENVAPYTSQKAEFALTMAQFQERDSSEIKFNDEQAIITAVHGERDRQIIESVRTNEYGYRRDMFSVMRGEGLVHPASLVRNVVQQQVTIHDQPDLLLDSPFDVPSFGLHPGTLQGHIQRWLDTYNENNDIPWAVKWLKEEQDPDQSNRSVYQWVSVWESPKEVLGARLIVVHPMLATYNTKLGFLVDRGGDWCAKLPEQKERYERESFGYRLETYEAHIQHVYEAAFDHNGYWHEVVDLAQRLERLYGWEPGSVRTAAELAVLLHDVGKLSETWQAWARNYQTKVSEFEGDSGLLPEPSAAYAHTTVAGKKYREIEHATRPKRPWHSVEGALACAPVFGEVFGSGHPLFSAAFSAIARHHAPNSDTNQAYRLVKGTQIHIQNTLTDRSIPLPLLTEMDADSGAGDGISDPEQDWGSFSAYLLLVRVLRLADQLGTARGARGENL